ncbi:mRNA decapping protein 2, Box A [Metarhizium rileyi]|uniref:mRNA decapping protein 2, Box A n=1 Tax=Metarhizium rileyi (strain RCEF 4871) TaxID=1649241 RepID=A0A167F6W6_METRR|nr:mRNA decapping protein 2, Box A [Metarhizium rileyi RCEF 4871]
MAAAQMQLEDWLDDLCVRFIINLPQEDLSSVARICFQVEEAQWFYEDFIRPLDPTLPSMPLRTFCLRIFQHCPLLASFSVENHTKAFEEFLQYKTRVPVRGAIMLNNAMDSVVLVKGWKKGANWSFPRGKINKDEDDLDCAIREVYEETGLDLRAAGLVPTEKKPKYIEILMREQQLRLYVFRDIPMDTKFQPRTRKEISKIQWYKLSELPAFRKKGAPNQNDGGTGPAVNKFYMVAPFLVPLKKWVQSQKKLNERRTTSGVHGNLSHQVPLDEVGTTEDDTWASGYAEKSSHVPAIETLDGATQELQRLLKMQPPTQGLQSPPQEDKGTALLSILQSSNSRPPPATLGNMPLQNMPLDATVSELPQPRNPHHLTELTELNAIRAQSQQPPPSFPYASEHGNAFWNPLLSFTNQPHSMQQCPPETTKHQQTGYQQAQPPVYEAQDLMLQNGSPQNLFVNQHIGASQNTLPGSALGPSLQNSQMSTGPGSAQLSGTSLALLNAFKRDTGITQGDRSIMNPSNTGIASQSGALSSQQLDYNVSTTLLNHLSDRSNRPADQTHVSELLGSSVQPNGDPHRSALLGMFKKGPSDTVKNMLQDGSVQQDQPGNSKQKMGQLGQDQNTLLRQFQADPSPPREHLSLKQLATRPKPSQTAVPSPHGGENPGLYRQQQQQTQQPPPLRILQRGQTLDDFANHTTQIREMSSKASSLTTQNPAHDFPVAASGSSLNFSSGDNTRRPDGAREQKQQLLSLFGKQQSPGDAALASGIGPRPGADLPSSRVSSMASRGAETPISPAEQTFLLDYLQSVTNKAGRK